MESEYYEYGYEGGLFELAKVAIGGLTRGVVVDTHHQLVLPFEHLCVIGASDYAKAARVHPTVLDLPATRLALAELVPGLELDELLQQLDGASNTTQLWQLALHVCNSSALSPSEVRYGMIFRLPDWFGSFWREFDRARDEFTDA